MDSVAHQEAAHYKVPGKRSTEYMDSLNRECREEDASAKRELLDHREDSYDSKARSSPPKMKGMNGNPQYSKKGNRMGYPQNKMMSRGPYGPPMGHPGAPQYGPPPYGYMGSSYGPPHHHYHHHGPPMHMPHYGGAPFHGHMGGPAMKGPGYPPHPHYHGPPYGMPPTYPHQPSSMPPSYPSMTASSDSASITSKSSMNSKKKRTIDGVHGSFPPTYTFRRTDSNSSSASTLTTGNNTSMETAQTDGSQQGRDSSDSVSVLNLENMAFEDRSYNHDTSNHSFHRRQNSGASTASSLSVCGFSLASYEGRDDSAKNNIKRHKKNMRAPLVVDTRPASSMSHSIEADHSSRFEHLSLENKCPESTVSAESSASGRNIFLALSTSPINASLDIDATPLKTNITKKPTKPTNPDRPSDTPTPPVHGELGEADTNDDHSMLNNHLRGQSFTPLPHHSSSENQNASPPNAAFASAIAPQLSWSIAGDTPSLGDLADWEDEHGKLKSETKPRPNSTTSADSRSMPLSPHDFHMWKEEHETDHVISGTTTPLPIFFEHSSNEGSENHVRSEHQHMSRKVGGYDHHPSFTGSSSNSKPMWGRHDMSAPHMYTSSDYRDEGYGVRSPHHGDRREMDYYPSYSHMGHGHSDRVRNLRGRVHPGNHMPPIPIHIPPPLSAHLPMTSPMGLGAGKGLWSPHHGGMPGAMTSPHHLGSPLANMAQSKRKCVPLKPPIPSKYQGDIEKTKNVPVPEFTSLVNFPSHMSQKQAVNLPDGMRCCVMCGQACPCSSGNKGKKSKSKSSDNDSVNEHLGDKNSGYAIIPTQNKGLCTLCDVNVWVVVATGLEIKWCKGCKNFRPWAAFGDKGLATKCLRCRDRQREKYALQKEEKEKTRGGTLPKEELL